MSSHKEDASPEVFEEIQEYLRDRRHRGKSILPEEVRDAVCDLEMAEGFLRNQWKGRRSFPLVLALCHQDDDHGTTFAMDAMVAAAEIVGNEPVNQVA